MTGFSWPSTYSWFRLNTLGASATHLTSRWTDKTEAAGVLAKTSVSFEIWTNNRAKSIYPKTSLGNEMNEKLLLANTKFAENHVKHIFDVDPSKQPSERVGSGAQFLGGQFLALPDHLQAPAQRGCYFRQ